MFYSILMQGSSTNRKRSQYKSYDSGAMEKAMEAVEKEGRSMYSAAKLYGVPINTLRDRLIAQSRPKTRRAGPSAKVWLLMV